MFIKISKSEDFLKNLQEQGKVQNLNLPKHVSATSNMNAFMNDFMNDFKRKNIASEIDASKTFINS